MKKNIKFKRRITQGDIYRELGVPVKSEFHPEDDDFSDVCDGWTRFMEEFPEKYREFRENREKYLNVYVEPAPVATLIAITVRTIELSFAVMAIKAREGFNTEREETNIQSNKDTLKKLLSTKASYFLPGSKGNFWQKYEDVGTEIDPGDIYDVRVVSKIKNFSRVVRLKSGELLFYSSVILRFAMEKKFFYIFSFEKEIKGEDVYIPSVKWDGKNLVALHRENMPKSLLKALEGGDRED